MEHYNTSITLEVSDITLEHIGIMWYHIETLSDITLELSDITLKL